MNMQFQQFTTYSILQESSGNNRMFWIPVWGGAPMFVLFPVSHPPAKLSSVPALLSLVPVRWEFWWYSAIHFILFFKFCFKLNYLPQFIKAAFLQDIKIEFAFFRPKQPHWNEPSCHQVGLLLYSANWQSTTPISSQLSPHLLLYFCCPAWLASLVAMVSLLYTTFLWKNLCHNCQHHYHLSLHHSLPPSPKYELPANKTGQAETSLPNGFDSIGQKNGWGRKWLYEQWKNNPRTQTIIGKFSVPGNPKI